MAPHVETLLEQALALPGEARIELAEALLSSVGPTGEPFPYAAEWLAEAKRRVARILSGEDETYTWEQVRDGARQRLREQSHG